MIVSERDLLGLGCRTDGIDNLLHESRQAHRLHVQAEFSRNDPRYIEDVFDDLRQGRGIPDDRLQRVAVLVLVEEPACIKCR